MDTEILFNILITKVNSALTLYTPQNTKKIKNNRSCWAMVIKFEGETIYTHEKKQYLSDKNNIVILPKGSNYEWYCSKAGRFSIIEFECPLSIDKLFTFQLPNSEKIIKLFHEIEYKRNILKPLYNMESIKDTYTILITLLKRRQKNYLPKNKQTTLSNVLEYIHQNYNKKLTNDNLANIAGLSTVYFRKLFTCIVGVSPIAYARSVRINKAKELLKSEYGSLTDVAINVGYADLYDFSRDFKKHTGYSPSNYH